MKDTTRKAVVGRMAMQTYFPETVPDTNLNALEVKPSRSVRQLSDIDKRKRDKKESRWDNDD